MADPHPTSLRVLPPVPAGRAFAVEVTTGATTVKIESDDEAAVARLLAVLVPRPESAATSLHILCPFPVPRQSEHLLTVAGVQRLVPAAVARVVAQVARGERELRLRTEVRHKLQLHLPELLARIQRNHERKATSKGAPYLVASVTVEAV